MYGFSAISFSPFATLPSSPEPPYLWFSECWSSKGIGAEQAIADERWETQGLGITIQHEDRRWSTNGVIFSMLDFTERWITQSVGGELVFDERWATFIPAVKETPADIRYQIIGVSVQQLPAWARWATEGAPINITVADERWATSAPVLSALDAWEQWVSQAPELAFAYGEEQWQTAVPQLAILSAEERWFFNIMVANALNILYRDQVPQALGIRYDLGRTVVRQQLAINCPMLTRVRQQCVISHPIRNVDQVQAKLDMPYAILNGAAVIVTTLPTLTVRGLTIKLEDVEISYDEGQYAWTCQMQLPNPDDYLLFEEDEPFTITIGGETYYFLRNDPRFSRSSSVDLSATIAGISPSAIYADPRAEKITKVWKDPVLVSDVLEELFGPGEVTLLVPDWTIPAGKLSAKNQTPMQIAVQIAEATGGFIESDIDGSLSIRHAYPTAVNEWDKATPDHVYSDLQEAFEIEENTPQGRIFTKYRVLDSAASSSGFLRIEVDKREDGGNKGRTTFAPGDQPVLLIFRSTLVELESVRSSAGNIAEVASGTMENSEEITFADTAEATLQYPTAAIDSFVWLGNDLGTPTVSDEVKLTVPTSGVAILKVTYTTAFLARRLSNVPETLGGETSYGVLVLAQGENA